MQDQTLARHENELASSPPILRMARRLEMLQRDCGVVDIYDLGGEISELEFAIAANPATSLSEAAVQVMLASAFIERLREDLVDDTEAMLMRLQGLMSSVLSAFVRETGLDLSEYGADRYLPGGAGDMNHGRLHTN